MSAITQANKQTNFGVTVFVVLSWYCSNIGMLLLNKTVLSLYNFNYPIFLTACHQACGTVLSYVITSAGLVPHQKVTSRAQLLKITLLALVFCASIVSNNASMSYIAVSFNQAIGATTPAFTAVMAFFILRKRESRHTYITLIPVVLGIVVASGWEPNFSLLGFTFCLIATATRSLKTVLQALLLADPNERMGSLSLLYYMSPIALVALLPLMLVMEDAPAWHCMQLMRRDPTFVWAFTANVLLSYCINLTNFLATHYTSALTIQVLGNAKGAVAVVVSILIFRNAISVTGMLGYAVCVAGCFMYSEAKRQANMAASVKHTQEAVQKPVNGQANITYAHATAVAQGGAQIRNADHSRNNSDAWP